MINLSAKYQAVSQVIISGVAVPAVYIGHVLLHQDIHLLLKTPTKLVSATVYMWSLANMQTAENTTLTMPQATSVLFELNMFD